MEESVRHLYYNSPNMRKTMLASCRSQFLLDRLGKCLKLFVSTVGTSCHKFASQYGVEMFLYAKLGPKTTPKYRLVCLPDARDVTRSRVRLLTPLIGHFGGQASAVVYAVCALQCVVKLLINLIVVWCVFGCRENA